jgi:hypothetical protein
MQLQGVDRMSTKKGNRQVKLAYNPHCRVEMSLVQETLKQERDFYMKERQWSKVSDRKRKLKACGEKLVRLTVG